MMKDFRTCFKSVTESYDDFINQAQEWGQGNFWQPDAKGSPSAEWCLKDLKSSTL